MIKFKHNKGSDEELHSLFNIRRKKGWSIRKAWNMLQKLTDSDIEDFVVPVLYRPFDVRWIFYHDSVVWRTVKRVMHHLLAGENLALCIGRAGQAVGGGDWNLIFCSTYIEDFNLFYRGGNVNFPLYLYPLPDQRDLLNHQDTSKRQPNLNPDLLQALAQAYGEAPAPEEILHYIYAVLYAPAYREQYTEFLRVDFPRIPFTADKKVFKDMASLGKRLIELHLLKSADLDPPLAKFHGTGKPLVAKTKMQGLFYDPGTQRVYINPSQFFAPVPQEVWEYRIGGYQVAEKWLKDRRGRTPSLEEIRTYCRVTTGLALTIEIQNQIDDLYPAVERHLLTL